MFNFHLMANITLATFIYYKLQVGDQVKVQFNRDGTSYIHSDNDHDVHFTGKVICPKYCKHQFLFLEQPFGWLKNQLVSGRLFCTIQDFYYIRLSVSKVHDVYSFWRALSLKFQKARTKIEVFLVLAF